MERLTVRNSEGIAVLKQPYQCERCGDLQWSLPDLGNGSPTDRLAEYEDIGLLPEQIKEVDRLYAEKCKEMVDLKEYRHLEEQGRLLKLPCAVGDMVYVNHAMQGWYLRKKDRPYKVKVAFIGVNGVNNSMNVTFDNGCMMQFWFSDIGKTIFLTKEEAESALKKL